MKDIILQFVVSICTSAAVSGAAAFFLKLYFEQRIKFRFDEQLAKLKAEHEKELAILKARVESLSKTEQQFATERIGAFKELARLVYANRDQARKVALEHGKERRADLFKEFEKIQSEFVTVLQRSRLFLDEEVFGVLHEFKGDSQRFTILVETESKSSSGGNFAENINQLVKRFDAAYPTIVETMRRSVASDIGIFPKC